MVGRLILGFKPSSIGDALDTGLATSNNFLPARQELYIWCLMLDLGLWRVINDLFPP